VRERIEELLDDPDFRVQSAAIEGLATMGDAAAIGALERIIGQAGDGRLRRRGREVVRDLAERTAQGDELTRLRDELAELKAAYVGLRDRVGKLEGPVGVRAAPPAKQPRSRPAPTPRGARANRGRNPSRRS
jgi:hypothetical protein